MTPCSRGSLPVSMLACTGQVTAGKLGVSVARSPAAVSLVRLGIVAKSAERSPGTERKITWGMGDRSQGTGVRGQEPLLSTSLTTIHYPLFPCQQWRKEVVCTLGSGGAFVAVAGELDVDAAAIVGLAEG